MHSYTTDAGDQPPDHHCKVPHMAPHENETTPTLATPREAAAYLRIHERTLARHAKKAGITTLRVGRGIRYHWREIAALAEE